MENQGYEKLLEKQNELLTEIVGVLTEIVGVLNPKKTETGILSGSLVNEKEQIDSILSTIDLTAQAKLENALQKQKDELHARIDSILSTIDLTAQAKLENALQKQKDELHARYAAEIQLAEERARSATNEMLTERFEQKKAELNRNCDQKLEQIKLQHEQQITELNQQQEFKLAELKRQNEATLENLRNVNNQKIAELTQENERKILDQEKQNQLMREEMQQQFKKEIDELSKQNAEAEAKVEQAKLELKASYDVQITKLKSELENKKHELNEYISSNGALVDRFDIITQEYGVLLEHLFACESLKKYCEEKRLMPREKGTDAIIRCIQVVGDRFSMASDIYNAMRIYRKKEKKCVLTDEEIKLIDAVNAYYRKACNREDENDKVLFLPDGCSPDALDNISVKFNPTQMQDLDNPLGSNYKSIKRIFTPCFQPFDGSLQKSFVEASEDPVR